MDNPIRVLGVDGAGGSGDLVAALIDAGFAVSSASSGLDAVKRLDDEGFDCVVVGEVPDAAETVDLIGEVDPALPVVIVTSDHSVVDGSKGVETTSVDGVAGSVRDAVASTRSDRVRRAHGRLKNAFRAVATAAIDVPDRDLIERRLYESLSETGSYQFIWIGEFDPSTHEFTSRVPVQGRFAGPSLAALGDSEESNVLERAVESGRVAITSDGVDTRSAAATTDGAGDATMAGAPPGSFRVAAIPFTARGEVVGAMLLTTDRVSAFDEAERSLLSDIGAVVGTGISGDGGPDAPESDRDRRRFAELLAHEVRSPLGIASSQLELARETGEDESFDRARSALSRIEETVDAILDVTRSEATLGDKSPGDIVDDADAAWSEIDSSEAELVIESAGRIRGHHELVVRLLSNLFRNAIDHGGDGVTIHVGMLDDGFYVADDGPGVDPAVRDRVFDWGYSTAEDGLGIGLGFVHEIARVHGWEVGITDSEMDGARFEITGVEGVHRDSPG